MNHHSFGRVETVLDIVVPALALDPVHNLNQIHIIVGIREIHPHDLTMRIDDKAPRKEQDHSRAQPVERRCKHGSE